VKIEGRSLREDGDNLSAGQGKGTTRLPDGAADKPGHPTENDDRRMVLMNQPADDEEDEEEEYDFGQDAEAAQVQKVWFAVARFYTGQAFNAWFVFT
jgi:hypothetical protein